MYNFIVHVSCPHSFFITIIHIPVPQPPHSIPSSMHTLPLLYIFISAVNESSGSVVHRNVIDSSFANPVCDGTIRRCTTSIPVFTPVDYLCGVCHQHFNLTGHGSLRQNCVKIVSKCEHTAIKLSFLVMV